MRQRESDGVATKKRVFLFLTLSIFYAVKKREKTIVYGFGIVDATGPTNRGKKTAELLDDKNPHTSTTHTKLDKP